MAFKDTLKSAFLPLAMAATSLLASPALALTTDKDGCMSLAEFNTQLAAEGQGSVIFGETVIPANANRPARTSFIIFTALKNGKTGKGYSFLADTPLGTTPKKMCVAGEFNNARGLNVADATIPDGVAANSNLAKVIDYSIKKEKFNPMFYGEKNGAITVVVGDPSKSQIDSTINGSIFIGNNDPQRKADDQGFLRRLAYSPNYLASNTERVAGLSTPNPR